MTGGRLCCSIMGSLVYCYTPPLFDSYQMMKAALIPESSINYTFQWLLGRTLRSYFHCPFKNVQIFYFQGKNEYFLTHLNFQRSQQRHQARGQHHDGQQLRVPPPLLSTNSDIIDSVHAAGLETLAIVATVAPCPQCLVPYNATTTQEDSFRKKPRNVVIQLFHSLPNWRKKCPSPHSGAKN